MAIGHLGENFLYSRQTYCTIALQTSAKMTKATETNKVYLQVRPHSTEAETFLVQFWSVNRFKVRDLQTFLVFSYHPAWIISGPENGVYCLNKQLFP